MGYKAVVFTITQNEQPSEAEKLDIIAQKGCYDPDENPEFTIDVPGYLATRMYEDLLDNYISLHRVEAQALCDALQEALK